jgi:putative signal transducing protein
MDDHANDWTEVWNCNWPHEAQFFKSVLESAGIDVFLPDEYTVGVDPGLVPALGGVRILVRANDVAEARRVLESSKNVRRQE